MSDDKVKSNSIENDDNWIYINRDTLLFVQNPDKGITFNFNANTITGHFIYPDKSDNMEVTSFSLFHTASPVLLDGVDIEKAIDKSYDLMKKNRMGDASLDVFRTLKERKTLENNRKNKSATKVKLVSPHLKSRN